MNFSFYLSINNLDEAYKMWERIDKENSYKNTPEFFSTHPSSRTRIENIKKWIPIVRKNFKILIIKRRLYFKRSQNKDGSQLVFY